MTGILLERTTANTVSRRIVLIGFYMHVHDKIKLTVPTLLLIYIGHTGNLIVAESNSSFRKKIINIIFFIGKSCLLRATHNNRKMSAIKSETGVITLVRYSHLAANPKSHITHFFEPTT